MNWDGGFMKWNARGYKSSKIKAITMLTNDSLQFLKDLKAKQQSRLVFRKQKKIRTFLKTISN
jgi:hypothetical protein